MDNLAMAREHVLFQHGTADGWVTMARKDPLTGRFMQYHYRPEDLADHLSEWMGENVYFSQGTFYRPARRIDTIRQLRSLYVDLDVYTKGLNPEWVLGKLDYEVFGEVLPEPNMVIHSGRGLVLIWNIEPIPHQAIPLWKAVETYFVDQLKELGADAKASDPARIFRIAGSVNSKNGAIVKADYRHAYRYDIHQIQYDYLPELQPRSPQTERRPRILRLFNTYTLHLARASDIAKIVELREGDVGNCREYICFLYRYYTCCYTDDPEQALQDTISLNSEFKIPLNEREVIRATVSAEKAWKARNNKEADEAARAMGYPGAGYNIKNKQLISWLQITEDEQQHLSTIIDTKEKRRRDRRAKEQKRREDGIESRETTINRKLEVVRKALKAQPDLNNVQLSKVTGIPRSTIVRLKKKLEQQQ